jgi:WD40 repeat protein
MRKALPLVCLLLVSAKFPTFDPLEFRPAGEAWGVVHSIFLDDFALTSARYTPDGNSVIAGSDYGDLMMADINTGKVRWKHRPFPGTKNAIFVTDVDPSGQKFLTVTSIGATEDHFTLNVHRTSDGRILQSIAEESSFYHKDGEYVQDHRRPDPARVQEIEEEEGSRYWVMKPVGARFAHGGRHILSRWTNAREDYGLFDVSFRLHDAQSYQRLWQYQLRPDKDTFDSSQPGGWQITLPAAPIAELKDGRYMYGNPHARLHILDEALIKRNEKIPNIMDKTTPPVFAVPLSVNKEFTDMAMTICDIQQSPDGQTAYVAAGSGGNRQVYAYDLKSRKEIWHSHEYDVGMVTVSPNGAMMATGFGTGAGSRAHLIDVRAMKHVYAGPRFGTMTTNSVHFNPVYAEALVVRGSMVSFLRKFPLRRIQVGEAWKGAGFYVRRGVSFYAFGKGELNVSTRNTPESDRWSRSESDDLFFGEADGRIDLAGDEKLEGEVYFKGDPGPWEIYGGLNAEEFQSVSRLRSGRWP